MAPTDMTPQTMLGAPPMAEERIGTFLRAVYGWMTAGLALTALTASFVASSPSLVAAVGSSFWIFFIAQIGIVFYLSARVEKLAASTASLLFLFYSALTGVTLSFILLAYTGESVAMTFIITAGMFGSLAMYGTATGRSLSGLAAYDAQRLKAMALAAPNGATGSYAVVGALALYLDFINLFLMLLRFFGNRRD